MRGSSGIGGVAPAAPAARGGSAPDWIAEDPHLGPVQVAS
jgi:hypothetical protein